MNTELQSQTHSGWFQRWRSSWPSIGIVFISALLVGCASTGTLEPPEITADGIAPPTIPDPQTTSEDPPLASVEPANPQGRFSELQSKSIMDALISDDPRVVSEALIQLEQNPDPRFISVLIELMRAAQLGIIKGATYTEIVTALETLSGKSFGPDWPAWIEWYGGSDLEPPPGFTGWKGELLGRIDPGFAQFLREDLPSRIRVEEIQWGGVRVDGIPALDNPEMVPAEDADYLLPEEPVFGISIEGDSRAYPLRILDWHEMANDVVGEVPVSLSYCTLCGAGVAFDGRASDGTTYTFGSSGFLFRSNKLMYDRQTRTLWNQLTGEPVLGELAGQGIELEILPVVLTSWADWSREHPETVVLALETGFDRPYIPGAAYGDYFASETTMFPVWQRSEMLKTKDRIYALRIGGVPKAYLLELLASRQVVNDTLGGKNVVLIAQRGTLTVDGMNLRAGEVSYNAGAEVRAYERGEWAFSPAAQAGFVLDQGGRTWEVTEEALFSPGGERAPRLGGHLAYWFGWFAFFPNTLVYEGE